MYFLAAALGGGGGGVTEETHKRKLTQDSQLIQSGNFLNT
jgi:hypothetical protein